MYGHLIQMVRVSSLAINICELEEVRFNLVTQTISEREPGRTAIFWTVFPRFLELPQPDYTRKAVSVDEHSYGGNNRFLVLRPNSSALGGASLPGDHVPLGVTLGKPTCRPRVDALFMGLLLNIQCSLVCSIDSINRLHRRPLSGSGSFPSLRPKSATGGQTHFAAKHTYFEWPQALGCRVSSARLSQQEAKSVGEML